MKVMKTTTYCGTEAHTWAARAVKAGAAVFGIDTVVHVTACGAWLVQKFPTTIHNEPCRLSSRGVYVDAPGGLTEQFLNPTDDSGLDVTFEIDGCEPVQEDEPAHDETPSLPPDVPSATSTIELDPDNPDGE
jgi:hypothetical protein